jgi:vesicle coat complex subunit
MRVQGWLSREEPSLLARHPESSGTAQPTDDSEVPSQQELKNALEKGSDDDKIKTLKRILILMLNGDPMPGLLMHVIRFIMPSKNKTLKKLLLVYWEVCPKTNPDGKLKQEMVLVWYVTVFFFVFPPNGGIGLTLEWFS